MAVPKKKVSKSRRNMRRFAGGNQLKKVTLTTCMGCSQPARPHRICSCGWYRTQILPKTTASE
jgi:large subunit ribosomal protein L32